MVTGIEHTAIASPDPIKLAQWYVDHLDFKINHRPAGSSTVFVKARNGSMIEIVESNAALAAPQAMRNPGLHHLAIAVTDFDAAFAHLQSRR
jgi:glyoxylase I family protein